MMDNTIERRTNNLTQVETMFDARRTPWDGLGKRIAGAVTSRDAIRLAGLDWNVVPTDIISEATGLKIPGYKANVRDIDNKTLGIVTERYKLCRMKRHFHLRMHFLEKVYDMKLQVPFRAVRKCGCLQDWKAE